MFKFFEKMKERWNCEHDYKLIKMNRVNYIPEAYSPFVYYTHDAECEKCGKMKYGVSTDWVKRNLGHKYMTVGGRNIDCGVVERPARHTNRNNKRTRKHPLGEPIDDDRKVE